jgi:hypothetical protein
VQAHRILAGRVMEQQLAAVLRALHTSAASNFVLCVTPSNKYKGLYAVQGGEVQKVSGAGSAAILPSAVAKFLKYDSGAKELKLLQTKSFTAVTTAVVLHGKDS